MRARVRDMVRVRATLTVRVRARVWVRARVRVRVGVRVRARIRVTARVRVRRERLLPERRVELGQQLGAPMEEQHAREGQQRGVQPREGVLAKA